MWLRWCVVDGCSWARGNMQAAATKRLRLAMLAVWHVHWRMHAHSREHAAHLVPFCIVGVAAHLLILDVHEREEARREAQPCQQPDRPLPAAHGGPPRPICEAAQQCWRSSKEGIWSWGASRRDAAEAVKATQDRHANLLRSQAHAASRRCAEVWLGWA